MIVWRLSAAVGAPTPTRVQTVIMNVHLAAAAASPSKPFAALSSQSVHASPAPGQAAREPARVRPAPVAVKPVSSGAPPGATVAGPAAAEPDGQARTDYESVLLAHLRNYFFYPDQARARRLQGRVEVRLMLERDGRVLGAWVQTSSGEAVLDGAALELVRRAQPMPAIPRALPGRMDVYLPLEYLPPKIMIGAG